MSEYRRIRLRRSSASGWLTSNPILALGEAAYETDSKRLKVGDGLSAWSGLDYVRVHPSSISYPEISFAIYDGYDPRIVLNLSSGEYLNIIGSGDTNVDYDPLNRKLIIETQSGSGFLTAPNIIERLGYTPQPSGQYSLLEHSHSISQISGLSGILNTKQPSGNYAISGHSHSLSIGDGEVTVINYASNDRLNIVGSGYTSVGYDNGTNTIMISSIGNSGVLSFNNRSGIVNLSFVDVTGALNYTPQPVGNYSLSGHKHALSDIFNSNIIPFKTLANSSAVGTSGEICWDSSYLYICIAANSWHRIPHSNW